MPMHPRCRRREDLDDGLEVCQLSCTLDDGVDEDLSQASLHRLLLHTCVSYLFLKLYKPNGDRAIWLDGTFDESYPKWIKVNPHG